MNSFFFCPPYVSLFFYHQYKKRKKAPGEEVGGILAITECSESETKDPANISFAGEVGQDGRDGSRQRER